MSGAVGIPYPVVGIEWMSFVVVHLAVGCAEIASLLAETYRPLVYTVESGVEYCFVVVIGRLHFYASKSLVPYLSRSRRHRIDIVGFYFASEIALGLLLADERHAIADVDHGYIGSKSKCHGGIVPFCGICRYGIAIGQGKATVDILTGLHVDVYSHTIVEVLIAAYRISFGSKKAIACGEHKIRRTFILHGKLVYGRLRRRSEAHTDSGLIEVDGVAVGPQIFVVVAVGGYRNQPGCARLLKREFES